MGLLRIHNNTYQSHKVVFVKVQPNLRDSTCRMISFRFFACPIWSKSLVFDQCQENRCTFILSRCSASMFSSAAALNRYQVGFPYDFHSLFNQWYRMLSTFSNELMTPNDHEINVAHFEATIDFVDEGVNVSYGFIMVLIRPKANRGWCSFLWPSGGFFPHPLNQRSIRMAAASTDFGGSLDLPETRRLIINLNNSSKTTWLSS